jgi:hypothetical protein
MQARADLSRAFCSYCGYPPMGRWRSLDPSIEVVARVAGCGPPPAAVLILTPLRPSRTRRSERAQRRAAVVDLSEDWGVARYGIADTRVWCDILLHRSRCSELRAGAGEPPSARRG